MVEDAGGAGGGVAGGALVATGGLTGVPDVGTVVFEGGEMTGGVGVVVGDAGEAGGAPPGGDAGGGA